MLQKARSLKSAGRATSEASVQRKTNQMEGPGYHNAWGAQGYISHLTRLPKNVSITSQLEWNRDGDDRVRIRAGTDRSSKVTPDLLSLLGSCGAGVADS